MAMRIGALKIQLEIPGSLSLKDKRMVIRSLKERLANKFNISIAEVDDNDKWQRSCLGVAIVSNDRSFIDTVLNKIVNFIDCEKDVLILKTEKDIL